MNMRQKREIIDLQDELESSGHILFLNVARGVINQHPQRFEGMPLSKMVLSVIPSENLHPHLQHTEELRLWPMTFQEADNHFYDVQSRWNGDELRLQQANKVANIISKLAIEQTTDLSDIVPIGVINRYVSPHGVSNARHVSSHKKEAQRQSLIAAIAMATDALRAFKDQRHTYKYNVHLTAK